VKSHFRISKLNSQHGKKHSLKLTAKASENRASQKETIVFQLPTVHFQVLLLLVSGRLKYFLNFSDVRRPPSFLNIVHGGLEILISIRVRKSANEYLGSQKQHIKSKQRYIKI